MGVDKTTTIRYSSTWQDPVQIEDQQHLVPALVILLHPVRVTPITQIRPGPLYTQ